MTGAPPQIRVASYFGIVNKLKPIQTRRTERRQKMELLYGIS